MLILDWQQNYEPLNTKCGNREDYFLVVYRARRCEFLPDTQVTPIFPPDYFPSRKSEGEPAVGSTSFFVTTTLLIASKVLTSLRNLWAFEAQSGKHQYLFYSICNFASHWHWIKMIYSCVLPLQNLGARWVLVKSPTKALAALKIFDSLAPMRAVLLLLYETSVSQLPATLSIAWYLLWAWTPSLRSIASYHLA